MDENSCFNCIHYHVCHLRKVLEENKLEYWFIKHIHWGEEYEGLASICSHYDRRKNDGEEDNKE